MEADAETSRHANHCDWTLFNILGIKHQASGRPVCTVMDERNQITIILPGTESGSSARSKAGFAAAGARPVVVTLVTAIGQVVLEQRVERLAAAADIAFLTYRRDVLVIRESVADTEEQIVDFWKLGIGIIQHPFTGLAAREVKTPLVQFVHPASLRQLRCQGAFQRIATSTRVRLTTP